MRDILFRGRKSNIEWVEGGIWIEGNEYYIVGMVQYVPDTRDWDIIEYYENYPVYMYGRIRVDPKTVGQYTGFKDKNGNKIFEGDIIRYSDTIRSVIFDEVFSEFEFDSKDPVENPDSLCLCVDYERCEIIGNIHDNPELLKGE